MNWIQLAIASGFCAATNGLFAKLTTTSLTTSFASTIARALSLDHGSKVVEYGVRAAFFALNLTFDAVMWGLYTAALAKGTSAARVSVLNVSANFLLAAMFGLVIFSEKLPPAWWIGAVMLVLGCLVIGKKEEGTGKGGERAAGGYEPVRSGEELDTVDQEGEESKSESGASESDS